MDREWPGRGAAGTCPLAPPPEASAAPADPYAWLDQTPRTAEEKADIRRQFADIDRQWPPEPPVSVSDLVDHVDYIVKKIGIDHVGISSDFDGGGGVDGWNGAEETFNVTLELVRRGYTEDQIAKIWSGNLLRVMDQVQAVAKKMSKS